MRLIVPAADPEDPAVRITDPCQACGRRLRSGQSIYETEDGRIHLLCWMCAAVILALIAGMPIPPNWTVPA